MKIHVIISFVFSLFCYGSGVSQILTEVYDSSAFLNRDHAFFFTNRPIKIQKDSTVTFKNKSTKQTNTLYFCLFNYAKDSIEFKYKAANVSEGFPKGKVEDNFFYDIYEHLTLDFGIKNYYFIIPGYGKTFHKQVFDYMKRMKSNYGDTLFRKAAIVTFAWGTEFEAVRYYRGLRSAKRGAHDFAIFQHMLEDFLSDSVYFQKHPSDITIEILCSSMGNHLFKEYLESREKNNIPLVKVYDEVIFVGSTAPRNSFKTGKAFHNLNQMTDTVNVFVNLHDTPLFLSSLLHFRNRMGNYGPKNEKELPGYIKVHHIGKILTIDDLPGLGHDYLLRNPVVREKLLKDIETELSKKKE